MAKFPSRVDARKDASCRVARAMEDLGRIIELGLALVLWNQDLSNELGQLAKQKIEHMRGLRNTEVEKCTDKYVTQGR